jgi:hypothetical protein
MRLLLLAKQAAKCTLAQHCCTSICSQLMWHQMPALRCQHSAVWHTVCYIQSSGQHCTSTSEHQNCCI